MKNWFNYSLVFVAWLIYLFLTFSAPITESSKQYGLNQSNITILKVTVALPILLIWLSALYGALHLKSYAQTIKDSMDGQAFLKISTGLFLLVINLVSSSILGAIRSVNIYSPEVVAPITIINRLLPK